MVGMEEKKPTYPIPPEKSNQPDLKIQIYPDFR